MTISELERRSGMTRGNIRFYEREGLVSPQRRENGYRDYTEEDLDILLRIRLLRSLEVPLSEIHELQKGELVLAEALDRHIGRLGSEQRQKARSEQVCRDILGSGESFEQLDAHRWLSELESGAKAAVSRCDCIPKLICPWRRYFARSLDLMLCRVVSALLIVSVFRLNVDLSNWFLRILMLAVGMTVMFVVEPFLLRFFGTTPGKWMLGLSVESVDGGRLSLAEARERTSGVLWKGLGLSVPGVELATLIISCYKHSKGEELSWERGSELRLDRAGWRVGLYAAVVLLVLGLSVVTAMETQMPRHRGDITAEEFCDNYNSLARFHGIHTDGIRLTTNGWIDTDHSKTFGGFDGDAVRYIFTEGDGELSSVTLAVEYGEDARLISAPLTEQRLLVMSALWGREGLGTLDLTARLELLDELAERALESYTIELENAEISCETSYTGELRGSYLTGTEEDPATLNMRFTVEFENEETRTDN